MAAERTDVVFKRAPRIHISDDNITVIMVALWNRADHYIFTTCLHNMVNFGPLAAEIVSGV